MPAHVPKPPSRRPQTANATTMKSALKSPTEPASPRGRAALIMDSVPVQVTAIGAQKTPTPPPPAGAAAASSKAAVAAPPPAASAATQETLPPGWVQLESRKFPGMFYYMGPSGRPQWNSPNATAAEKTLVKEKLASIYMKDYKLWDDVDTCNPKQLNEGTKASASYHPHPVAKQDKKHFVSLKQQDFVEHKVSRPAPTTLWPIHNMPRFESNSTYRSDFRPSSARRPKPTRQMTPPRMVAFDHNSINRTDYVDHHPKRPKIVHPVPQLHFTQGTAINSTNRVDFVDHGFGATARSRRPKYFRDPGWIKNWRTGMSASDCIPQKKTAAEVMPEEELTIRDPLTDREDLTTMVPVIDGKLRGGFDSTYRTDYVEEDKVVPIQHRRNSKELDRLVVRRVKAHEELRGLE